MREQLLDDLRGRLHQPGTRGAAVAAAAELPVQELQQLFPDLLALASFAHGLTERCRDLLLRLPQSWLLANLEQHAAPLLAAGGYEECRALLAFYSQVDRALTRQLAERAIQDSDADIREAGDDFLHLLGSTDDTSATRTVIA